MSEVKKSWLSFFPITLTPDDWDAPRGLLTGAGWDCDDTGWVSFTACLWCWLPDRDLTPGMRETSGGQRGICRPMNGTAFWAEKSWKVSKFVWNNFKCLTCQNSSRNNYFSNTSQILTPAAFRPRQSEASIQVTWSLLTNRMPVFPSLLLNAAQTQRGIQFHTEYCSLGPGSNKFCNL